MNLKITELTRKLTNRGRHVQGQWATVRAGNGCLSLKVTTMSQPHAQQSVVHICEVDELIALLTEAKPHIGEEAPAE